MKETSSRRDGEPHVLRGETKHMRNTEKCMREGCFLCIFINRKLVTDETLRCELEELLLGSVKVTHESWQAALRFKARLESLPGSNCCVLQHSLAGFRPTWLCQQ